MGERQNDKYLVVKWSALEEEQECFRQNPNYLTAFRIVEDLELPDAVVIRRQDLLAPALLDMYADQCTLARTVLIEAGAFEQAQALERQESYFKNQARLARMHDHPKLPD